MAKEGENQKVVVIQTRIDLSWNEMKWMVDALPLNNGDELILLGVMQLIPPPASSFLSAAKMWGNKIKEDPNKITESNRKLLEEERRRMREEYKQNGGVIKFQEKLQLEKKVKVSVEIATNSSRKVGAVRAIKRLGATWIILDREMKKDKQYFVDRVSCGISCMKSNNTIVPIRNPINEHVSYDEMIPSYSGDDASPSKEASASCYSTTTKLSRVSAFHCSLMAINVEQPEPTSASLNNEKNKSVESRKLKGIYKHYKHKEFENTVCSVCNNRRPQIDCHKDFTYADLHEATNGFSRKNFISEGGFGFVYRGKLKGGQEIAVKQHKAASQQGEKEFKSEVYVLSEARHQNLVMLLGSCAEGTERLLVYEYICNGSLEYNLSSNASEPLNWEQRMKIARGAAKGLAYLHDHNIVHRDVRPGNILITHDYEALLGDFGLAKAQQDDTANSSGVVGTLGYVAPEYAECGKLSNKTDVYSFGVVLLQLITGLRTTDEIDGGKSLVGWAKPLLESKNYPDLIDRRILDSHDVHQLFWMVLAAESCLHEDPDYRLTMEQVVNYLNCNKEVNENNILDYEI